jgi:hypothetical protein
MFLIKRVNFLIKIFGKENSIVIVMKTFGQPKLVRKIKLNFLSMII